MKILIIDDESLARDILKSQLDKLHYQDILMADNGKSALRILKNELPDIVFLDIRMPEMSGIEFMEKAAEIGNQFIFIILSGYNLFEYAQRTMELGAFNYLLKPIDDCKLREAMDAVEAKLQLSKMEKENYFNLNQSSKKDKELLRKQYIYELITENRGNLKLYDSQLQEDTISFHKPVFQICFLSLKEETDSKTLWEHQDMIQFGIENIITELAQMQDIDVYFFWEHKINGMLFNYEQSDDAFKEFYHKIYTNIHKYVAYFKEAEITMGIGIEVQDPAKLRVAYTSAKETLHKKLILGGGTIYFASCNQKGALDNPSAYYDSNIILEESVIKGLYQGDAGQILQYLDDYYASYLQSRDGNIKKLHKMHLNLFVLLHKELEKQEIESSQILENEFLLYHKIQACDSIQEMKAFLYDNIQRCMEALEQQTGIGNEKIMIRAKEFIKQNIGFELTLESVSEHVNFSPAYFSKFFKTEEGLKFIDYVNKMRVEEAKELLNCNIKTADICNRIGFSDVKHFYKVFKRWEGITPGQYKKGLFVK